MIERTFHINLPFACYGIISINGVVKIAPPIARWMIDKRLEEVKPYLIKHKAKIIELIRHE